MIGTEVNISGYKVSELIYSGSRTLIYRGYREIDHQRVVIKLLKNSHSSVNEIAKFRHQYNLVRDIQHPGIIQIYSLEVEQNSCCLVMEDFGGITLKDYFSQLAIEQNSHNNKISEVSLEEFLKIGISLCDILNTLYHQRIIHQDIKPSNILINPHTKQIKLIDFSIASLLPQETESIINSQTFAGTLAYISPEQTGRINHGIDYRTDFYALGVTFYELMAGNLPFSAFVQALRDLIGQLLTESAQKIQQWKKNILEAVGENGRVITEVIPELEKIIGTQPSIPELSGIAAQNRFNSVFKKFIQTFTSQHHPLVIFLDDLQWVDPASLKLIETIISENSQYLLLIAAYRNNEVSAKHPLEITWENLSKIGVMINHINIKALNENSLNQLVVDTLHCLDNFAIPLTQLVFKKTQGNPFFAKQFLKVLDEDNLIVFNYALGCWQCDITKVKETALTDDVVEFMAQQLKKLPSSTQEILKLAACLGNQFDLINLAAISQQSEKQVAVLLWNALQEGFIVPQSEVYKFYADDIEENYQQDISSIKNYKFYHDRIQEVAYSLNSEVEKQLNHLKIGRLLLTSHDQKTDKSFDIANQLNMAIPLIHDQLEKNQVAQINLQASQKARTSIAYLAAFDYAKKGIHLLNKDSWKKQYHLTLSLYNIAADTAFLTGQFAEIPKLMQLVKLNSQTVLDSLPIYESQIQADTAQKNYQKSINTGLEFIHLLGIKVPSQPNKLQLLLELIKIKIILRDKSPESLLELPVMENIETIGLLRICNLIFYPAYFCSQPLAILLTLLGLQKSIQQGNSIWSSSFYLSYSIILSKLQQLESSYEFGQFSLKLLKKLPNPYIEGRIKVNVALFNQSLQQPLSNSLQLIREGTEASANCGDFAYAGMGCFNEMNISQCLGKSLTELSAIYEHHQVLTAAIIDESSKQYTSMLRQVILNLTEISPQPHILVGAACDETQLIPQFKATKDGVSLYTIYSYKVLIAYLFNQTSIALDAADARLPYEKEIIGLYSVIQIWFYDALTRLAAYPKSSPRRKKQLLQRVGKIQSYLEQRAKLTPGDIRHKCDLIQAERDRVLGNHLTAQAYYDLAIRGAKQNQHIQEEALANELAARFYLERGQENIAKIYIERSHSCYTAWGATAKVLNLEQSYPQPEQLGFWVNATANPNQPQVRVAKKARATKFSASMNRGKIVAWILDKFISC